MLIKVKTLEAVLTEFIRAVRNNCSDKITKFLSNTVINGIGYGISKLILKINNDAAYVEGKLFPEYAIGDVLDDIALREGIPERLAATKSTVPLIFKASSGTVYPINTQVKGAHQVIYKTLEQLTIGTSGVGYVLGESLTSGKQSEVDAFTLDTLVAAPPVGHLSVINTVKAEGGYDQESDYEYRSRILNINNILMTRTRDFYYQLINQKLPTVLRIKTNPTDHINRNLKIVVAKNNGGLYTSDELLNLKNQIIDFLPLRDANLLRLNIENVSWTYIDIYARIYLDGSKTLIQVAQDISLLVQDYLNYKYWEFGAKVDFETLQSIVRNVGGVKDLDDKSFTPNLDVTVDQYSLPKLRNINLIDATTGATVNEAFGDLRVPSVDRTFVQILNQQQQQQQNQQQD